MQTQINKEVIPILTHYETTVDEQFKGVLEIGEILKQKKYIKEEIENLTEKNSDYWRAIMEMSHGNQLIPFTKVCMHISKGELDIARKLLFIINFFMEDATSPSIYHEEISGKLDLINKELKSKIGVGIAFHDEGKYKKALDIYFNLLEKCPKSALLHYEIYFSKTAKMDSIELADIEWMKFWKIIYKYDPMYYKDVFAKSGKQAYLLVRREEINELFKSKENFKKDFVEYADIALELGNYDFAAHIYWLIIKLFT